MTESSAGGMDQADQIVFHWSEHSLTGDKGVGPVAASLPPEEVERWGTILRNRVWADQQDSGDDNTGLAYLRYGEAGVVLRKRLIQDERGRDRSTLAHALIGPAGGLSGWLALGLADWPGWVENPADAAAARHPVPLARLRQASGHGRLRTDARKQLERLAELLTCVLDDPAAPLTVIDPSAHGAELICGVIDLLGEFPDRPWTFSTREANDTGDQPALVFLAAPPPVSMHGSTRRRLRLGDGVHRSRTGMFAADLTALYGRVGLNAVLRLRPPSALAQVGDVTAWIETVYAAGILADITLIERAAVGEASAREVEFLRTAEGERFFVEALAAYDDTELPRLLAEWAREPGAALLPRAAERVRATGVRRCLELATADDTSDGPQGALAGLAAVARATEDDVRGWWDEGGHETAPDRLLRALHSALVMGVDLAAMAPLLFSVLPTATLLDGVTEYAVADREFARLLLDLVRDRTGPEKDPTGVREVLARTGFLADLLDALVPGDAARLPYFATLLRAAYGPRLTDPRLVHDIVRLVGSPVPPALLNALHRHAEPESPARGAADRLALAQFYGERGLPYDRQPTPLPAPAVRPLPSLAPRSHGPAQTIDASPDEPRRPDLVLWILIVLISALVGVSIVVIMRGLRF